MSLANISVFLSAAMIVTACVGETATEPSDKPKIVEVFACSDYCPGPKEQYIKRVYEDVTDGEECRRLGGKLDVITGLGMHTICEVQ